MKHPLNLKKNLTGFQPENHWKIILGGMAVMILASIGYGAYLYVFARKQIDSVSDMAVASTSPTVAKLATPEKIQESFKAYKDRAVVYEEIMADLTKRNRIAEAEAVATTVIATSSEE